MNSQYTTGERYAQCGYGFYIPQALLLDEQSGENGSPHKSAQTDPHHLPTNLHIPQHLPYTSPSQQMFWVHPQMQFFNGFSYPQIPYHPHSNPGNLEKLVNPVNESQVRLGISKGPSHSPITGSSSRSIADTTTTSSSGRTAKRTRMPRKRSAPRSTLIFVKLLDPPHDRIRLWRNDRKMYFYDCVCNTRIPIQDLQKIKEHSMKHDLDDTECRCKTCGRLFSHTRQMNGHMKAHSRR